jgi:DNA polymerase II small subunit
MFKTETRHTFIGGHLTSRVRRNVLAILIKSGYQVTPDALDFILNLESPVTTVESVILTRLPADSPPVLSKEYVESLIEKQKIDQSSDYDTPGVAAKAELPIDFSGSQESSTIWQWKIEKSPSETMVGSEGVIDDFLDLFRDRYNRIRRIYMSRIDTQNAVTPDVAKMRRSTTRRVSVNNGGERAKRSPSQVVLGIIRNKNISKQRNVIIDLEGFEDSIICVIPSGFKGLQGQQLSGKADALLLDEIVCISGHVDPDGRMIADDILFPDIPTARQIGRAKKEVYAAFISDIHCGSHEFLEDEFDRFIDWMNGIDVESSDKNMIEKIRYLFIAGDLVDGISVYPEQRDHLKITSLYEQYAAIAEKLRRLPKDIKVFCIPGNHDASRQALPKPPIPKIFAEPLYTLENVTMLGDPSQILVEGVSVLMTHGDSQDDLVTTLPGASYTEPAKSMTELLKKRHLAPIYGGKTEIAPLHRDWMVIDTPPDVVHFGHAHHNAVDNYRGVQIINSGTFQSQTDFMRKQGVVPTPGIVTLLNLQTGAPEIRFFCDLSKE